jgi:hypothetical protein
MTEAGMTTGGIKTVFTMSGPKFGLNQSIPFCG